MKADFTLDAYGLLFPMHIVRTAEKMKEMQPGQVLEVVSTDEGIKEDMPAWAKATNNEFLGVEEEGEIYKAYVRKK